MKLFKWAAQNILFLSTLFLLVFIPLYPKLPLLDVKNTWVYIRAEDFVVVFVLLFWIVALIRRKITLKTPLTLPIFLFWIIAAVSTIHGILLIFPTLSNVFANVAFLSFLRRVEYLSLFFIAYSGLKDKRFLPIVITVITITLLLVVGYGFGQKFLGFPAYLTMNEEFAKGLPIRLSELSRVPSTFGGHYDLAAYLVLMIPILTSMVFGFRSWLVKVILLVTVSLGFVLLFMTVSRVSFFVLLIALFIVLFFQKKRIAILSLPIVVILSIFLLTLTPQLLERFGNTIKETDVLVEAKTGDVVGHVEIISSKIFENKVIKRKIFRNKEELDRPIIEEEDLMLASPSAIVPFLSLPEEVIVVSPPNTPTGENLPQGTGYINLSLSPVIKRTGEFLYKQSFSANKQLPNHVSSTSADAYMFQGDFLVKRASAYDLSFTTRFQGEWPRAIEAFKKNILFGSGYSSISLAVDNNYLRILGEVGLLGFISYFAIFVIAGIYIRKVLPEVDSPIVRSFVLGFIAGVVGLILNAVLIDVFDASKIAFLLSLLTGVSLGILHCYQTKNIDLLKEFKKAITSTYAIIGYILVIAVIIFSPMIGNYFVGDDFTWFRWAASSEPLTIFSYFTESDGFFYRPGTKIYFLLMYSVFWLNQTVYHAISILVHFITVLLVFFLAKKVFHDLRLSVLASFLFLILSSYSETIFWISSTGSLICVMFILLSLLLFIEWKEKGKNAYYALSLSAFIFSLLFHELGVVTPFLIIMYVLVTDESMSVRAMLKKSRYIYLSLPILFYLGIRYIANSHWFSGDYNYNVIKLPFNIIGNTIGYFLLAILGPISTPFYQLLRNISKNQVLLAALVSLGLLYGLVLIYRIFLTKIDKDDKKIVIFGFSFFILSLLPFLGLGNITSRYSYLSSIGVIILFVFFVKKLYTFLLSNGRDIAISAVTMLITLFSLFHIMQIQQIHSDWYEAGEKARRFIVSIESLYSDYWKREPMEFYFVNMPIRHGEAWVFPVGLTDALWFAFRNPNIYVYQSGSVDEAISKISGSKNQKVFEFDERGRVTEREKIIYLNN